MAQSRLEKVGSIYTRITSLLKGGAMKEEDIPVWYAVYKAFPPKVEPRYDRSTPKIPIRKIFYKEDTIRAEFQKKNAKILATSLMRPIKKQSRTQQFISIYQETATSEDPKEKIYEKAMETWKSQNELLKSQMEINRTSEMNKNTSDWKEKAAVAVDMKNIFDK